MKLTTKEIAKIARLARLELTDVEQKLYAKQLSVVLNYIEILNEVNTDNIKETYQVTGLQNITREDEIIECNEKIKKKIIDQFPNKKGNLLKVKAIFSS